MGNIRDDLVIFELKCTAATKRGLFGVYSVSLWHLVYEWAIQWLTDFDKSKDDK